MKFRAILLASACAAASVGNAQANPVWYVGVEGGSSWIADTDVAFKGTIPATVTFVVTSPAHAEFSAGWALLATVGQEIGGNWRVEGELGYRSNKLDLAIPITTMTVVKTGSLDEISLMVNWLLDVPLTNSLTLSLGAGLGADYANLKTEWGFDATEWSLAYQGIVGLSFAVDGQTDVSLNFRHFRVPEPEFSDDVGPVNARVGFDDIGKNTLTLGLRRSL